GRSLLCNRLAGRRLLSDSLASGSLLSHCLLLGRCLLGNRLTSGRLLCNGLLLRGRLLGYSHECKLSVVYANAGPVAETQTQCLMFSFRKSSISDARTHHARTRAHRTRETRM